MAQDKHPNAAPRGSRALTVPKNNSANLNLNVPTPAGVGNPSGINMSTSAPRALGDPIESNEQNCPPIPSAADTAVSCSTGTIDFLRANVPRWQDLEYHRWEGYQNFTRKIGTHLIPLMDVDPTMPSAKKGSIIVPDGMTLLVTHFIALAMIPNVGLPGAFELVDPAALNGFVVFNLKTSVGQAVFSSEVIVNGEATSGMSLMLEAAEVGTVQVAVQALSSVQAYYNVTALPFQGFPARVGVKVSGYFVNTTLLSEALGGPQGCVPPSQLGNVSNGFGGR